MAAGGDEYTSLGESPQTGEYAALDEAVIEYIKVVEPTSVVVEGRVNVVETEEPAVEEPVVEEPVVEEPVVEEPATEAAETYTVVSGDVLWKIAENFGLTWEALSEFNNLENPNLIYPGDVLEIPAQ
jgi:5'-nucleotidase